MYQEMRVSIAKLDEALIQLSILNGRIGHNNPPAPIEPAPFGSNEIDNIKRALEILKAQSPTLPSIEEVRSANREISTLGTRLKTYLAKQSDNFVSAAVKAAGTETGKWFIRVPLIVIVADRLMAVVRAVVAWLASLGITL
jgi:hypothetical protein